MKNCIITGGNSGIGFQAARQIAEKGYHVTLICRNRERAAKAVSMISAETGNEHVDYQLADLSSMADVRQAAEEYLLKNSKLDVLINNAADFDLSIKKAVLTDEGMEKQFATNVAAPYLLSNLLMKALRESGDGRIINISSQGLCVYPFIKLDLDNLDGSRHYSPSSMYYQNKLALLMLSLSFITISIMPLLSVYSICFENSMTARRRVAAERFVGSKDVFITACGQKTTPSHLGKRRFAVQT